MAKMFYTLDEAASKLSKSEPEVMEMVKSGQLSEFRDGDELRFKVEQVDLLVSGEDGDDFDMIPLAASETDESGLGLTLEDSAPSFAADTVADDTVVESAKEQSGISIFDTDDFEEADSSADTLITGAAPADLATDSFGSGSGLIDLTQEADDTSLGADLLDEVYSSDDDVEDTQGASGLFEETATPSDVSPSFGDAGAAAAGAAIISAEVIHPGASGFAGGAMLGALVLVVATLAGLLTMMLGPAPNPVMDLFTQLGSPFIWAGIGAGVIFLPAIIGWLIMRGRA